MVARNNSTGSDLRKTSNNKGRLRITTKMTNSGCHYTAFTVERDRSQLRNPARNRFPVSYMVSDILYLTPPPPSSSTPCAHASIPNRKVERYKQLLMKQRDIMIALTQRLNERDDAVSVPKKKKKTHPTSMVHSMFLDSHCLFSGLNVCFFLTAPVELISSRVSKLPG